MISKKPSVTLNVYKCFSFFMWVVACYACDPEDVYEDNFQLAQPIEIVSTRTFPGIVRISIIQSAPISSRMPSADSHTILRLTKLRDEVSGTFAFSIKLYDRTPLIYENIGYISIIRVNGFNTVNEVELDLGKSFQTPLIPGLMDIQILDAGFSGVPQSENRGYYDGYYSLLSEGDTVLRGNVSGIIDFEGQIRFELKNIPDFRFIEGHGVDDDSDFDIYAEVRDVEGADVSSASGRFRRLDSALVGSLLINSSRYDSIQLQIQRREY